MAAKLLTAECGRFIDSASRPGPAPSVEEMSESMSNAVDRILDAATERLATVMKVVGKLEGPEGRS